MQTATVVKAFARFVPCGVPMELDTPYPLRILSFAAPGPDRIAERRTPVHRAPAVAAALLALAACKVAPTPQQYLDPRDPAAVERSESEQEIMARVGAFREALARGQHADAVGALAPTADAHIMGVDLNGGRPRYGPMGLSSALQDLRLPTGAVARMPDLQVSAETREGGLGWFATHVEVLPVVGAGGQAQLLRVSGVLARREGEWRLLEMHLSRPELPAPLRRDSAATARDSAPPPSPAAAAAPPAGE